MDHVISALHLELVLAAHKSSVQAKWCVMSAHTHTQACEHLRTPYRIRQASVASPMSRGDWHRTLERIAAQGAKAVRQEYGIGIRALRAENPYTLTRSSCSGHTS